MQAEVFLQRKYSKYYQAPSRLKAG